jgi:hypothetical protein
MSRTIAHAVGPGPVYGDRGPLPDTATLNPRLKLLMFITPTCIERRERRFGTRDMGSHRSGVTRSNEAA